MILVGQAESVLCELAPLRLAQPWDNVGLIAGDRRTLVRRCLLCIDLTCDVVAEAVRARAQLIVSYHPPIFKPIKSIAVDAGSMQSGAAAVFEAIRGGIAVYSPHTALDAAEGGTGDAIAALCDATIVGPLDHAPVAGSEREVKIATFVPRDAVERVAAAMFAAGAGRIGLYEKCSFRLAGTGTFFGTEGTDPQVGRRGRMEHVDETRLEMVCPMATLPEALAALRKAHPYEEPAHDVLALVPKPGAVGIGRLARLRRTESLGRLAARLARATHATCAQLVGDPKRRVQTLAILVGSAGRVDQDFPRSRAADVLVTGEIRHHDALALRTSGWSAIALGHWPSERPVLRPLAVVLRSRLPGLDVRISKADRDPFRPVI